MPTIPIYPSPPPPHDPLPARSKAIKWRVWSLRRAADMKGLGEIEAACFWEMIWREMRTYCNRGEFETACAIFEAVWLSHQQDADSPESEA